MKLGTISIKLDQVKGSRHVKCEVGMRHVAYTYSSRIDITSERRECVVHRRAGHLHVDLRIRRGEIHRVTRLARLLVFSIAQEVGTIEIGSAGTVRECAQAIRSSDTGRRHGEAIAARSHGQYN